jgi:hypothetical protein
MHRLDWLTLVSGVWMAVLAAVLIYLLFLPA